MKFANVIKLIKGRAYRVVEDQEEIAILELVDDIWEGMTVKPSSGYKTSHTIFQLSYQTDHGIQLQGENFKKHHVQLTYPSDYQFTQAIGSNMREQGITGLEFISARDMSGGINVAFFNPKPIRSKRPLHKETLTCLTHNNSVVFKLNGSLLSFTYPKADFSPNGFFARIS